MNYQGGTEHMAVYECVREIVTAQHYKPDKTFLQGCPSQTEDKEDPQKTEKVTRAGAEKEVGERVLSVSLCASLSDLHHIS